jgi:hypothetical protein
MPPISLSIIRDGRFGFIKHSGILLAVLSDLLSDKKAFRNASRNRRSRCVILAVVWGGDKNGDRTL